MHGEPNVYGESDLTYNDYLRVPSLLDLQIPQSKPAHHDEMLFIVIHQAYELWFKLILHEMKNAIHFMEQKEVLRAHHFTKRIVEILKLLVQQIHILEDDGTRRVFRVPRPFDAGQRIPVFAVSRNRIHGRFKRRAISRIF